MLGIGVQTKNVVEDADPTSGFALLKEVGFTNADFSLNSYLLNTDLYRDTLNKFFDKSKTELEQYFEPHKRGAKENGININQMHMPYPIFIPTGKKFVNDYLVNHVMPKSMHICDFFECPYLVVHGLKLARYLGSEDLEWQQTEEMLDFIAPMAKEMGITLCIENLYEGIGGHLIEGPCCNIHKVVERIDRFNEKYHAEVLGFCFDTGHANLVGLDFEKFITKLDYRLKVLHIHDNDGIADLHQIPYTFSKSRENTSSTDWNGFLNGLNNIKFNKVLSFETAPVLTAFPNEMKKEVLSFLVKIGQHWETKLIEC